MGIGRRPTDERSFSGGTLRDVRGTAARSPVSELFVASTARGVIMSADSSGEDADRDSHNWSRPVGEFAEWLADIGRVDTDPAFDGEPTEGEDIETVLCYDEHRDEVILKTAEVPGVERPTEWLRINASALVGVCE